METERVASQRGGAGRWRAARLRLAAIVAAAAQFCGACSGGDTDGASAASPPGAPAPSVATALFVIGDSLSDIGNAAGLADYVLGQSVYPPTVGLCNPADVLVVPVSCDDLFYRRSRVSDGPVAVEHLAAALGVGELLPSLHVVPHPPVSGTVYAVAGAKARGQEPIDLAAQVDLLLLEHAPLPADAVYVVMIGGNDAIDAVQALAAAGPLGSAVAAEVVTAAVNAIGGHLERLLDFGARRVVVANVPNLALLPGVRSAARASGNEAALLAAATGISTQFDRELTALLDKLAASGQWTVPVPLDLRRFDLDAALAAAQLTLAARGANVLDACFASELYRDAGVRSFNAGCAPLAGGPPRFADFAYWDDIHPTGAAHALLGQALIDTLREN